jgi:tetratricopeptide (TPR) repeat protein
VLNRRFAQYEESATRLEYAAERITYTTTVAERLRENGEFELLAMLYNSIGNTELRDKYIDLALDQSPSDDSICFLRGMQGRPDLIPPDVAERRLERQEELADWTQRARTLMSLGRPVEAARDYVRGILHSLENENPFGAAYYLKELVRRDIIDALLATALAQAAAADDLWWQIRALQELGWGTELDALVVEHADEIEESGNSRMLVLLRRAEGREEEATTLDIALTAGRRRVIVDGESFVGEPVGEGQDDP